MEGGGEGQESLCFTDTLPEINTEEGKKPDEKKPEVGFISHSASHKNLFSTSTWQPDSPKLRWGPDPEIRVRGASLEIFEHGELRDHF